MVVMLGFESGRDVALMVRWKTRSTRVSAKVHSMIMTMLLRRHDNRAPPRDGPNPHLHVFDNNINVGTYIVALYSIQDTSSRFNHVEQANHP